MKESRIVPHSPSVIPTTFDQGAVGPSPVASQPQGAAPLPRAKPAHPSRSSSTAAFFSQRYSAAQAILRQLTSFGSISRSLEDYAEREIDSIVDLMEKLKTCTRDASASGLTEAVASAPPEALELLAHHPDIGLREKKVMLSKLAETNPLLSGGKEIYPMPLDLALYAVRNKNEVIKLGTELENAVSCGTRDTLNTALARAPSEALELLSRDSRSNEKTRGVIKIALENRERVARKLAQMPKGDPYFMHLATQKDPIGQLAQKEMERFALVSNQTAHGDAIVLRAKLGLAPDVGGNDETNALELFTQALGPDNLSDGWLNPEVRNGHEDANKNAHGAEALREANALFLSLESLGSSPSAGELAQTLGRASVEALGILTEHRWVSPALKETIRGELDRKNDFFNHALSQDIRFLEILKNHGGALGKIAATAQELKIKLDEANQKIKQPQVESLSMAQQEAIARSMDGVMAEPFARAFFSHSDLSPDEQDFVLSDANRVESVARRLESASDGNVRAANLRSQPSEILEPLARHPWVSDGTKAAILQELDRRRNAGGA